MRRRCYIFVSPRVLPRSGLLPGVRVNMFIVPRRGSLAGVSPPDADPLRGTGGGGHRPWVGTTPWYQPTANENIAAPRHQMPSGHIRHSLKLIVLY